MNYSKPTLAPYPRALGAGPKSSPPRAIAGITALALAVAAFPLAQVSAAELAPAHSPRQAEAPAMPSFADVAARVTPAVVNVMVTQDQASTEDLQELPERPDGPSPEEFFHHFFHQPGPGGKHGARGLGSGFLIDPSGYIVTNLHVIDGADDVTVTLQDGAKFKAQVVGRDDKTDLALIKVDAARPLPYLDLDTPGKARVGDWVLAVGNPFGLGGSVNAGIISAQGRNIHSGPYDDYIQIDAPINRGNSGGPLFDAEGHVIGVNTAIYSPTGGNVGIGFAIPADTVRTVVAALRTSGRVERGWLGVQIQPVTEELAQALGLKEPGGVLVADIVPNGPAAHLDIQPGDVILSAGGQPIKDGRDLPRIVAAAKPGASLRLQVLRNGESRVVEATLGAMPDSHELADKPSEPNAAPGPRLGVYLAPLTPDLRREKGIAAETNGVYVVRVAPNSPASRAGIEPGTLISMVGTERVTTPEQVIAAVRKAAEDKQTSVLLRIERDGGPLFVAVPFAA